MSAIIRNITTFPLTAVRLAFRVVRRLQRGPAPAYFLPVAGLTQERAHTVMFSLREAAHARQEDEDLCVSEWLAALATAQAALDRLQMMMAYVEGHLAFWRARLDSPRHGLFLLVGRGPVKFGQDLLALSPYRRRLEARQQRHRLTSTERIEQRVTILRALQHRVAAALGAVNSGAGALHLRRPPPALLDSDGHQGATASEAVSASSSAAPAEPEAVLLAARSAILASLSATTRAFEGLRSLQGQLSSRPEALALLSVQIMPLPPPDKAHDGDSATVGESRSNASAREDHDANSGSLDGSCSDIRDMGSEAVAVALQQAQNAVGADPGVTLGMAFTDAMRRANKAAYRMGAVLEIPSGLRAPSKVQQHWLKYVIVSGAATYGALFVYRHSRMSGSRDLEMWAGQAATGLRSTYRENVLGPLAQLRNELFKTFRSRRSIVSEVEYENDRESLRRMLLDFRTDYVSKHGRAPPSGSDNASNASDGSNGGRGSGAAATAEGGQPSSAASVEGESSSEDMAFMMKAYEAELKRPIRSAVTGQLPRTLLIQVQKLKLDTEAAMLQMDQLLKANELNLALIAAIPAFLVAGGAVWFLVRWVRPSPVDPKYEALPCRMAMVALERSLQAADGNTTSANIGLVTYAIAKVYAEAHVLYARHNFGGISSASTTSEWPSLRQDLTELAGPAPLHHKMRLSKRMSRVYSIFQF